MGQQTVQTPVCGVQNICCAADEDLRRLLDEIGRNGPVSEIQAKIQAEVTNELALREVSCVSIGEGKLHHRV
jgi:hypothetical protein